jgi:hypothetical protein
MVTFKYIYTCLLVSELESSICPGTGSGYRLEGGE